MKVLPLPYSRSPCRRGSILATGDEVPSVGRGRIRAAGSPSLAFMRPQAQARSLACLAHALASRRIASRSRSSFVSRGI